MTFNPYQPPGSTNIVPDAPPDHGWSVNDGRLLVKDGGRLPMIDPFDGRTDDRMTLHPIKLKLTPLWRYAAGIAAIITLGSSYLPDEYTGYFIFPIIALGLFILLAVNSIRSPRIRFEIFLGDITCRRMRRTKWSGTIIGLLMILTIVLPTITGQPSLLGNAPFPVLLVLLLIHVLISRPIGNFICRRKTADGFFEIKGVKRRPLEELRKFQESRRRSA